VHWPCGISSSALILIPNCLQGFPALRAGVLAGRAACSDAKTRTSHAGVVGVLVLAVAVAVGVPCITRSPSSYLASNQQPGSQGPGPGCHRRPAPYALKPKAKARDLIRSVICNTQADIRHACYMLPMYDVWLMICDCANNKSIAADLLLLLLF
jgi:hypothetical protein